MKRDSTIDCIACILFKLLGPLIRSIPLGVSLFLGKIIGELFYYFDPKHKSIAYANIKTAFSTIRYSPSDLSRLTKEFYRAFGQNFLEIFFVSSINKEYLNKYINIEGLDYIARGFKRQKGVILLGMHEGSWELSNIISANLGFPFVLLVRDQRYPRLNKLLNLYRSQRGCRIIERENQTRQLIEAFKNNEAIGMTVDQGGKTGTLVKFFGKEASMPQGAIRLALKYDATLIPVFYTRINGPKIKVIIEPPFEIKKTGNLEKDIYDNLQAVVHIFENYIRKYPQEYLWTYKIWKYGREKNILILSDNKTGHLRQAQAVGNIVSAYLKEKGIETKVDTLEIKFKSRLAKIALTFSSYLADKFHCQGCLWCLKTNLLNNVYNSLLSLKPDIIISCGSSVAPVNYVVSRENVSKSIVVMRPSILSTKRFDLVVMPCHDNPPKRKNVVVTEGALNLIDEEYLREQTERLNRITSYELRVTDFHIGLLIGGDTKNFYLEKDIISEVIKQMKSSTEKWNTDVLVTTSRRTPKEIEELVKNEFKDYSRCKLLVIANEKNLPFAMGGILGLSKIVIVSPESISMISEAASSGRYIIVFKAGIDHRHNYFLDYMSKRRYIYLCRPNEISMLVDKLWKGHPDINRLEDRILVREALKKIV